MENQESPEEKAARLLREREESGGIEFDRVPEDESKSEPLNLGKAQSFQHQENSDVVGANIGWKPVPVENLPSQGRFYPHGTTLEIRSAQVQEIRHFSTIDEQDPLDLDDKLNMIIDKCVRMKFPDRQASWKDLKEEDRFYLIFAVRDITFINGENKLFVNLKCGRACAGDGSYQERLELVKENFEYYSIDERLMEHYDETERCFVLRNTKAGNLKLYIPSLGVTSFIKSYVRQRIKNNEFFDRSFLKIAPFLFDDWRQLNDKTYQAAYQDSVSWGSLKYTSMLQMAEMIRFGVKTDVSKQCKQCGVEVRTPMSFPGGIKSLFISPDPFAELFG